jgi:hypothetical protein
LNGTLSSEPCRPNLVKVEIWGGASTSTLCRSMLPPSFQKQNPENQTRFRPSFDMRKGAARGTAFASVSFASVQLQKPETSQTRFRPNLEIRGRGATSTLLGSMLLSSSENQKPKTSQPRFSLSPPIHGPRRGFVSPPKRATLQR